MRSEVPGRLTDAPEESPSYMSGFGNSFATEARKGALPERQNNPQECPYGLYAEQISGTAFTTPRRENQRTWMYRIRPSVKHLPFQRLSEETCTSAVRGDFENAECIPDQLRWQPFVRKDRCDFVDGLRTICGAGRSDLKDGFAIHIYSCSLPMAQTCFSNADGDFLIVPQQGALDIETELGRMAVDPGEIAVVQRGFRYRVQPRRCDAASGYILEVFNGHFCLPELGPIGANGLANPRDFLTPVAAFEDRVGDFRVITKLGGRLFAARMRHSPLDVVAWHGNYAPFKYDLARFCPVNAAAFDHPDPSIFTVLTCASAIPGTAIADFVIFPPRWTVAEGTFRPPYFHRNAMSEFMGLIRGSYDGKAAGFMPGGASLHTCMSPHGPDARTCAAATAADLRPTKLPDDTLAFMFEVNYIPRVFPWALECSELDKGYHECWQALDRRLPKLEVEANGLDV